MELIKCNNLGYAYKENKVLEHINFSVEKGEVLGVLGPNGAGKSTLMTICATLLKPSEGEIVYYGDISIDYKKLRRKIGFVPQEIALYEELTPAENLYFFGKLYGLKRDELKLQVAHAAELTGIAINERKKIKELSGGMKRRVNIAAAIINSPEILIMDEPTVGIDIQSRREILMAVGNMMESGKAILYSSHYFDEIVKVCSKILVLKDGKVSAYGTSNELIPKHVQGDVSLEENRLLDSFFL
ncbi:ABC transporter ATP-binding protein [Alkaliphilus peptidifermentans]|uniref:ABC-2 type transport system ATP-binding protein n=1 Tax=Alkaliphilus peptidifermentans DSM 18978 TaxID=1120976 RepID=A0A1G5CH26_9FIRM|nr:ABC transporter ATP-binding protein [Alkaliphilus peptidifermentans]SCY01799.1 ABC-2 type transport system ATP-binding protein [Alkaliphilus peptidifermentans DSM 18978]